MLDKAESVSLNELCSKDSCRCKWTRIPSQGVSRQFCSLSMYLLYQAPKHKVHHLYLFFFSVYSIQPKKSIPKGKTVMNDFRSLLFLFLCCGLCESASYWSINAKEFIKIFYKKHTLEQMEQDGQSRVWYHYNVGTVWRAPVSNHRGFTFAQSGGGMEEPAPRSTKQEKPEHIIMPRFSGSISNLFGVSC